MKPELKQRIKEFICRVFGHFPHNFWTYGVDHAECRCCGKVLSNYGDGWE